MRALSPRLALAAGLALACALAAPAAADERIARFSVDLHLEEDGELLVVEEIDYRFPDEPRRGIFRDIPIRYAQRWERAYDVGLEVLSVTDEAGSGRPYQVSDRGAAVSVRIGDPDRTVGPRETYRITYRVRRATVFRADYDELYWNVTGNGWSVPIDAAEARVYTPGSPGPGELRTRCFTGPEGSTAQRCAAVQEGGSVRFHSEGLAPGEGLTVAVGLPKGVLAEPGPAARAFERFRAWGGFWLLSPLAALLAMRSLWRSRGRDPGARDAIPVRYEPPEGLTPAEAGTLLDESADMADITATLLDLAVHGYLEIEETESRRLLFFSDRDYWLRKKREPDDRRLHERKLFRALFRDADEVQLSALKNRFYTEIPDLVEGLYAELAERKRYFSGSPDAVRTRWRAIAVAVAAAGAAAWAFLSLPPLAGFATVSCGVVVGLFAGHMPARTRRGRRAYEELLGFQEFMEKVDRDRLERMGGRSVEQFERCLPYAIVLGVADAWADAFADLYARPPDWYHSTRYDGAFHPRIFVSDVGRSLGTMGDTFASRPSSSGSGSTGWSSGGAFSGGGGFSGGGFGGGGGGSW